MHLFSSVKISQAKHPRYNKRVLIMTQDNTKQVRRRGRYSAQFKAELVAEYLAGGVSLASLAISHDINPNTIPCERSPASAKPHHPDKIPVHEKTEKSIIAINLAGKNGLHAQIHWPTQEGSKLAEFICELLT